jgi:hypothetical protein
MYFTLASLTCSACKNMVSEVCVQSGPIIAHACHGKCAIKAWMSHIIQFGRDMTSISTIEETRFINSQHGLDFLQPYSTPCNRVAPAYYRSATLFYARGGSGSGKATNLGPTEELCKRSPLTRLIRAFANSEAPLVLPITHITHIFKGSNTALQ